MRKKMRVRRAPLFATNNIIRCFMNEKNKAKFKKLFTGAAVLATSCALAFAPACSTTSDSTEEDENTSTKQDTQLIKNGNFEFYDDNDGTYFISSPDNWTIGTTGNSSNSMSGIIDTSKSGWDELTDPELPEKLETNDDLDDDDDNKVDYNGALTDDLPFANPHEATNTDETTDEREYIANPYTHEYSYDADGNILNAAGEKVTTYEDEDGNVYLDEEHTKPLETSVLMMHNYRKSYYTGTESYCQSSSTVTLEASTAASISVWVKTSNLYFDGATNERTPVNGERGAYIQVNTTVGGNSLDSFKIRNIDTEKLNPDGENNGWVQYTVYVEASSFASTTVSISVGLGEDSIYTVEGYAFFDDISITKYMNGDEMREAVNEGHDKTYFDSLVENSTSLPLSTDGKDVFRVDKEVSQTNASDGSVTTNTKENNFNDRHFYIDLASSSTKNLVEFGSDTVAAGLTVEKTNTGSYVSSKNNNYSSNSVSVLENGAGNAYLPSKLTNNGLTVSDDLLATLGVTDAEDWTTSLGGEYSEILTSALKSAASLPGADGSASALVMLSANGAAYQSEITDDKFTLQPQSYALVSFWIKTADMNGNTAATVTVKDVNDENNSSNFTLDSTDVGTVTINDQKDVYNGWVQCFVRVSNTTEEAQTFKICVNLGITTIQGTTPTSYTAGWLAITNMSLIELDEDVYGYTSSGTYLATLSFSESSESTAGYFDSEQGEKNVIQEDVAIPSTYKGVNGASAEVVNLGKELTEYDDTNRNPYAGLINKEYLDNYKGCEWYSAITALKNLNDNEEIWNTLAGKYSVQPLLIVNTARAIADRTSAIYNYGYIGNDSTISASGYMAISVRVKVSAGAVANIYLTDTDPASKQVLSFELPEYTFWYDDDGNILKGEPKENASVAELRENIAYKLRKDGLYENGDGKLYANFYNLERYYDVEFEHENFYDEDGKLVKFEDLVQGEIYYANAEKTAYAPHYLIAGSNTSKVYKYNSGVGSSATYLYMVNDEADADKVVYGVDTTKAALRYDNTNNAATPYQFTIDATTDEGAAKYAGKWITVTFYVHGGSSAKNYRLELWSGYRDEETSGQTEGSYVLFDYSAASIDESGFNDLVSYYTGEILDEYKKVVDSELADNNGTIADFEKLAGQKLDIYNYSATYYTYTLYDSATYVPFNAETAGEDTTGYAYTYSDYSESLGFLKIEDDTLGGDEISMSAFIDYSVVDKTIELSGSTDVEEDTTEEETTENDSNIWLLAASIAIVIAILIAIISIVIRDIVKRHRRRKTAGKNSYNFNKNKRYVRKYVKANGETPEVKEEDVDRSLLEDKAETAAPEESATPEDTTEGASDTEESAEDEQTAPSEGEQSENGDDGEEKKD